MRGLLLKNHCPRLTGAQHCLQYAGGPGAEYLAAAVAPGARIGTGSDAAHVVHKLQGAGAEVMLMPPLLYSSCSCPTRRMAAQALQHSPPLQRRRFWPCPRSVAAGAQTASRVRESDGEARWRAWLRAQGQWRSRDLPRPRAPPLARVWAPEDRCPWKSALWMLVASSTGSGGGARAASGC